MINHNINDMAEKRLYENERISWNLLNLRSVARRISLMFFMCFVAGVSKAAEPAHPSLLFSTDDIAALKTHVQSGWMKEAFEVMRKQAVGFMDTPTEPYQLEGKTSGRRLNARVSTLALTGLLTENERYCNKAVEILLASARDSDVEDYVELNHHLSVGDGAHAYAMAYDWLWAYMTDAQREIIRNEIREFGAWLYDYSMEGRGYGDINSTQNLSCNHNSVVHGGLGLCALVLGDKPDWCGRARTFVRGYLQYARDETGYNYEGIGYYSYGSWGAIPFGVALKRAGHGDIFEGIASLPLVPNYILRQMVPTGDELVSMNDSGDRLGSSGGFMYLLSRFQDRVGLWAWLKLYGKEGDGYYGSYPDGYLGNAASIPYTLIFADPSLTPLHPAEADIPLHTFFERGSASFRSGWDELDAMATFTCGYDRHRGHNQRDENSFTFFARGERFAIDPGYDPVSTRCHNSILINGAGQEPDEDEYDVQGRTESTKAFGSAWATTGNAVDAYPEVLRVQRARRQFLFVNAEVPYLVIADDVEIGEADTARYTWLLHTDRANEIGIDKQKNTAYIKGARRGALCMVKFIHPRKGLDIRETNLGKETFEGNGSRHKYAEFFRELRAEYSARKGRFIVVIAAADAMDELPDIRWKGGADDLHLGVKSPGGQVDTIRITRKSISFSSNAAE